MSAAERFCRSGERETLKGSVHGLAAGVLGVMALYNFVAWLYRDERHLGFNAALYGLAAGWELRQTVSHWRRHDRTSS